MKAMVGFLFFILFLAGIALVMLQGKQMAGQNLSGGGSGLAGIRWKPVYIGAEQVPADSSLYVEFEVDGSIKGHGGCNGFFGSLESTDDGISIGPLGATRMACPEPVMSLETTFLSALQSAKNFELSGERLLMVDESGTLLVELSGDSQGG